MIISYGPHTRYFQFPDITVDRGPTTADADDGIIAAIQHYNFMMRRSH